ncbi:uncharacterized protein [Physcomitrium patens]|uniref:SnoaL-like domain-containing protein n=1 Tax=Physcomitrium patens TaxID=3218 RepID=A0A2K1J2S5_PHYPA|nr:uncharacterized protein LOC112294033 [Physcomitrium patens]PNR35832.1 hypothetical protein PHYPA_021682 [Physcomitrium patens]|eukprot:XP_024399893.1 uncharacterized protein LOC112294033 [Physcomitrella patens]
MAATAFVASTAVPQAVLKPCNEYPSVSATSGPSQARPLGSRIGSEWPSRELSGLRRMRPSSTSSWDGVIADSRRADGFAVAASSTSTSPAAEAAEKQMEAAVMVQEFYAAINRREITSIGDLFADNCVYEDLVFPTPFTGRQAILDFFKKFMDSVGSELEFRIDDITTGDPNAAGVIWHLEWRGKPLPFSKGCSFYRCEVLNGKRQFVYGRDAVEPASKPGDFTLVALKGLAALLRTFPSLADRF